MKDNDARARAESRFQTRQAPRTEAEQARHDHAVAQEALQEKVQRLRALRIARDAAEAPPADKPRAKRAKTKR